jgi:Cof subfamily protein (haloacid dehalogenase superfamily)
VKEIKLLALDMDGTTVDDDGNLRPETIQSLDIARESGAKICFVTGRSEFEMTILADFFDHADYLIVGTGALTIDLRGYRTVFHEFIDPNEARTIVEFCLRNNYLLHAKSGKFWGVNLFDDSVKRFADFAGCDPVPYRSIEELPIEQIDSMCLYGSESHEAVLRLIREKGMNLYTLNSQLHYYDILRFGVSKWSAVKKVAAIYGIEDDQILAAGNYSNDIDMLRHAGIGVAVSNATDDAKAAADYITLASNNHNAVGEIVNRFILHHPEY